MMVMVSLIVVMVVLVVPAHVGFLHGLVFLVFVAAYCNVIVFFVCPCQIHKDFYQINSDACPIARDPCQIDRDTCQIEQNIIYNESTELMLGISTF